MFAVTKGMLKKYGVSFSKENYSACEGVELRVLFINYSGMPESESEKEKLAAAIERAQEKQGEGVDAAVLNVIINDEDEAFWENLGFKILKDQDFDAIKIINPEHYCLEKMFE
jgi:hypothetical protein